MLTPCTVSGHADLKKEEGEVAVRKQALHWWCWNWDPSPPAPPAGEKSCLLNTSTSALWGYNRTSCKPKKKKSWRGWVAFWCTLHFLHALKPAVNKLQLETGCPNDEETYTSFFLSPLKVLRLTVNKLIINLKKEVKLFGSVLNWFRSGDTDSVALCVLFYLFLSDDTICIHTCQPQNKTDIEKGHAGVKKRKIKHLNFTVFTYLTK